MTDVYAHVNDQMCMQVISTITKCLNSSKMEPMHQCVQDYEEQ